MTSAVADRGGPGVGDPGQRIPLSFLSGARRFRAAVTAREFFDSAGGVDKLLFAGEKRMASGADADSNVGTRRAGVINRAARTDDIG